MPKAIDLTGQRFRRLFVKRISGQYIGNARAWECLCDCGKTALVVTGNLRSGATQSCGCLNRELATELGKKYGDASRLPKAIKHGMSKTRVYRIWIGMRQRCENTNSPKYYMYGARGITICEAWHEFKNFLNDMGEPPTIYHSIGRINNDAGYSPDNCRWETIQQQQSNMRSNVFLEYRGESMTVQAWSGRTGINHRTIHYRLQRGWSVEETLETPALRKGYKHRVIP